MRSQHPTGREIDLEPESETDSLDIITRSSAEVRDSDRGILNEEDEREKLLTGSNGSERSKGLFGPHRGNDVKKELRKERRRERRRKSRRKDSSEDEQRELMFEMEEGGPKDEVNSQASSSSTELDKWSSEKHPPRSRSHRKVSRSH